MSLLQIAMATGLFAPIIVLAALIAVGFSIRLVNRPSPRAVRRANWWALGPVVVALAGSVFSIGESVAFGFHDSSASLPIFCALDGAIVSAVVLAIAYLASARGRAMGAGSSGIAPPTPC